MSLPAIVDSLEDLPEAVRAFYVETEDGRFRLDAEGVEDVSGLKSALEKEREARKALKARCRSPARNPTLRPNRMWFSFRLACWNPRRAPRFWQHAGRRSCCFL